MKLLNATNAEPNTDIQNSLTKYENCIVQCTKCTIVHVTIIDSFQLESWIVVENIKLLTDNRTTTMLHLFSAQKHFRRLADIGNYSEPFETANMYNCVDHKQALKCSVLQIKTSV